MPPQKGEGLTDGVRLLLCFGPHGGLLSDTSR
jgi:hypothetical protein